jgi:hypothetical protein
VKPQQFDLAGAAAAQFPSTIAARTRAASSSWFGSLFGQR